MTGNLAQFQTL